MSMERKPVADRVRYSRMSGAELREAFVVGGLFTPGEVKLVHWEAERSIVGSAVPTGAPLRLEAPHQIKAEHFLDRRELGVANLGGAGSVTTDGTRHELAPRDLLYVGRGTRGVEFASADPSKPAFFYLVSHPAHASHPTTLAPAASAETVEIGDAAHASRRTLRRHIHARGVRSCQLVMGITGLASGSVEHDAAPTPTHRRTLPTLAAALPWSSRWAPSSTRAAARLLGDRGKSQCRRSPGGRRTGPAAAPGPAVGAVPSPSRHHWPQNSDPWLRAQWRSWWAAGSPHPDRESAASRRTERGRKSTWATRSRARSPPTTARVAGAQIPAGKVTTRPLIHLKSAPPRTLQASTATRSATLRRRGPLLGGVELITPLVYASSTRRTAITGGKCLTSPGRREQLRP